MARGKKAQAAGQGSSGQGHNSKALSDDEKVALLNHHLTKLRTQKKVVDELVAKLAGERQTMSGLFLDAKKDGQWHRKELNELLVDGASRARDLVASEERRRWLRQAAGLPVGSQLDMFGAADTPTEAKDELAWEADGYLAGRRGDDPTPPSECDPRFHQARLKGWHDGQARNAELLGKAKDVLARKPGAPLTADEPEAEPDLHEQAKKDAAKLKDSGWMEPTPAEAELETA